MRGENRRGGRFNRCVGFCGGCLALHRFCMALWGVVVSILPRHALPVLFVVLYPVYFFFKLLITIYYIKRRVVSL